MTTIAERLVELSGLSTGTVLEHFMAIDTSGGSGETIIADISDLVLQIESDIELESGQEMYLESDNDMGITPDGDVSLESDDDLEVGCE